MSSQRASKRRVVQDSDDEDDYVQSSPRKSRRTHELSATPNGRSTGDVKPYVDDAEDDNLVKLSQGSRATYGQQGGRTDDDYVPGSVVRVKLSNFMTYDYVEFHPGPRLNMILGPNGTGKSSIAAAIAIGLGFPPKIMGRSPELKSYVKQDAETATIEVELKGPKGKRNYTIWHRFSRDGEKPSFKLNGAHAGKTQIANLVANLGVQANNLCSFLPQDKVSDFAKMNPITVLKETMRAAGNPQLTQWHTELIENGSVTKTLENELGEATRKRDNLQRQVDALEPEIRQLEARRELEKELEIAKCVVFAAQWYAACDQAREAKADLIRFNKLYEAENRKIIPLHELQENQFGLLSNAETEVKRQGRRLNEEGQKMDVAQNAADKAERSGKQAQMDLRAIREKVKKREQQIRQMEDTIRAKREVIEKPQADQQDVHEKLDAKKKAIDRLTTSLRARESKRDSSATQQGKLQEEARSINHKIDDLNNKHQRLSDVELRKRQEAFRLDPSIQYAVEWIEQHSLDFESEVFFPPMMSVNVADKQHAWQVEMCTSLNQRKTFIVQTQSDYKKLLALNGDKMPKAGDRKCAIHLALVDVTQESVNPPRPCTSEQMTAMGFDGYAIDYIEAKPPVIAFLCQNANLHRSALTLRPGNSINGDRVAQAGISTWVTQTDFNRATRSAYGRRDFQFSSSAPAPARAFSLSVDTDAIKAITDEIANHKRRRHELEQPLQTAKKEFEQYASQVTEVKSELATVKEEANMLRKQVNERQEAHLQLASLEKRLKDFLAKESPDERRGSLKQDLLKSTKERVAALEEYQAACTKSLKIAGVLSKHAFAVSQLAANCRDIKKVVDEKQDLLQNLENDVNDAKERVGQARASRTTHMDRLQEAINDSEHEIRDIVTQRGKTSATEAKAAVADLQAQLELAMQADPGVVGRHKRLAAELEDRVAQARDLESRLEGATASVDEILGKFNPALDELVSETSEKFSDAFQRIGCTGEVRVKRVEGHYAEWGIEILVSYRDTEPMEVLTANRQSGGERSLATVTYLMSLAKLSRTPFSLVDEINQGMDQRAERNVHNQMVEVTCNNAAGQYFLITPKLLTNLKYHPKMRILTVNNGTWIPDATDDSKQWGRIGAYIAKYRAAHAITA